MNYKLTPKFLGWSTSHGWEHRSTENNQSVTTAKRGWFPTLKSTTFSLSVNLSNTHRSPLLPWHFTSTWVWLWSVSLMRMNIRFLSTGGLTLWLILWLVVMKPGGVAPCPRLCVCYPTPMTVSCQSQNLTIVPAGVPYDSQRVFLQNNRITELRADSFGFETQVNKQQCVYVVFPMLFFVLSESIIFLSPLYRCFGYMATTSHGLRLEPLATSECWRSWIWAITLRCDTWKVEHSGAWRSCRACICIAASWLLSPMISSTNCTVSSFSTCR